MDKSHYECGIHAPHDHTAREDVRKLKNADDMITYGSSDEKILEKLKKPLKTYIQCNF